MKNMEKNTTVEKIIMALDDYGRSVAKVEYGLPIDSDTKSFDNKHGEKMKSIVESILNEKR